MNSQAQTEHGDRFDYIVVGSGAGGGPLAARLALAGYRVLVIEAGTNHASDPAAEAGREVSSVPGLHAASTEHDQLSWRFFVKHYEQPPSGQDPKWHVPRPDEGENETHEGIFYPRAAALGGCTVHNAMITVAGPDSDWDDLADFLSDESWRGNRMRPYFQRLERNQYAEPPRSIPNSWWGKARDYLRWLFGRVPDYTGGKHGFHGWLQTSVADLSIGLNDRQLVKMLKAALKQSKRAGLERAGTLVRRFLKGQFFEGLDPNHARTQAESPAGLVLIPLSVGGRNARSEQGGSPSLVKQGRRSSPRELLLQVQASRPNHLTIWTDCLVTKVLFDRGDRPRAIGVRLLKGKRLYRAHRLPNTAPGIPAEVFVEPGGEVILCGGAFNTPQLLMLSGLGDAQELTDLAQRSGDADLCSLHGPDGERLLDDQQRPRRIHLPGVGRNLQDRYEITVISEMKRDFSLLKGATLQLPVLGSPPDPHLQQWRRNGTGLYATNGAVLGILKRSRPDLSQPDLFIFGFPLPFYGYEVGYSQIRDRNNYFTWTILKGNTRNYDGTVKLRSTDPLDTPVVNFHYFNERTRPGASAEDPDLLALVDGVKFVRGIGKYARAWTRGEHHPGYQLVPEGSDEALKNWIRRDAWGHHACGTCRMGPEGDPQAVLDSRFRVRGVAGLRVVDASIFPKIPGYFIVTNIYMASEKAADVLLADAQPAAETAPEYPHELQTLEAQAIAQRRQRVTIGADERPLEAISRRPGWPADVTGLALSGGGIRSSTLNLGILQALAHGRWLRRIDFLSTVSGGGYVGCFLGRTFDRLRSEPVQAAQVPKRVEQQLTNTNSREIDWLRRHGNYLAPTGHGDWRLNFALFLRNFLSVHFVVATLLLALFGLANAIRYGLFERVLAANRLVISKGEMPLGNLLEMALGPFFSPWFVLFELLLLFLVVPRIVGYWIVSQDRHEHYQGPALSVFFLITAVLLYLTVREGFALEPFLIALALLSTFVHVELTWWRGRKREDAIGSGGVETQRLRTRNLLTYDLGTALALTGAALAFAVIDTIGHGLQQVVDVNEAYTEAFTGIGVTLAALIPIVRMAANLFAREDSPGAPPSTLRRIFKRAALAGALALLLLAIPLISIAFAAHALYDGGSMLWRGLVATALMLLISWLLAHPKALTFVNRSSLAQAYGARLARAYLGASNPLRHRPEASDVTEVVAGDDVASIRDYRPHEAGGPLHLINVTVNQTVDFSSQRGNRDRKGENLAVSCLGLTVGWKWHSTWTDSASVQDGTGARKQATGTRPVGHSPGTNHPLIDASGTPAGRVEMLSLRQWMAISGAAVGAGRGQTTALGKALLFGLGNLRTGYWWDSHINDTARDGFPNFTFLRRLLFLAPRLFPTHSLLLYEWIARYPGPWARFWHISDGGFFENLGGYELIRRRVPRIIVCDGSADPNYGFDGFAELVRKARIDFDAAIEPFTESDLHQYVPAALRPYVGTLDNLKPFTGGGPNRIAWSESHAALFWVRYLSDHPRRSVLLYLKASVTGDEDPDVEHYHALHPEFPHESTGDQFFDEAQWESYRQLGQHLAWPLVQDPAWFWAIPL